jgi:hypothetical protein
METVKLMKITKFTLFNSTGSPVIDKHRFESTWDDLATVLTEHQILDHKEDAKLISPVSFVPFDQGVRFNEYDDKIYLKRCKQNIDQWFMLPVDIDGEMSIQEAKERFKDYEYVLYTSYNHGINGAEKFRLFFPLLNPVKNEEVFKRVKAIHAWLWGADKTTLSQSRQFYLPSCSAENYKRRHAHRNKGNFLDILYFDIEDKPEIVRKDYGTVEDDFKAVVLEMLGRVRDVDYDVWWKIGSAMQDAQMTYPQFEAVSDTLRSHRPDRNCEAQWESSRGGEVSFGYIINLLKEKFGEDCFKKQRKDNKKRLTDRIQQKYHKDNSKKEAEKRRELEEIIRKKYGKS